MAYNIGLGRLIPGMVSIGRDVGIIRQAAQAGLSLVSPLEGSGGRRGSSFEVERLFDRLLPPLDRPRRPLRYAGSATPARRIAELAFGKDSKFYSALGLASNAFAISIELAHYSAHVGPGEFLSRYLDYALSRGLLPVAENTFLDAARRHYLHGIDLYARALRLDCEFEGVEKIPKEGIVVELAANHASIFPDFLFAWADPYAMPVADADNFSFNLPARIFGAALCFDLIGLPLLSRKGAAGARGDKGTAAMQDLNRRTFDLVVEHGIRPIFFGNGGRVPTAYEDGGDQAPAGFYANAPDPHRPDIYFQPGGAVATAARLATDSGSEVSLAVISMRGTERVMPKDRAKSFPFFGPCRTGQSVSYKVVDVIGVRPGEKNLTAIARQAREILKRDLGIDPYLCGVVRKWAWHAGRPAASEAFERAAGRDERLFMIADRIRCIHPRFRERRQLVKRLLDLVDASGGGIPELLLDVTRIVKAFEYRKRQDK
jgi:hypothetical protein